MPFYENTFIARQDLAPQQVEGLTEAYLKLIKDHGGEVVEHEYWGLRTLSYPIKKNTRGHYVLLKIDAPIAAVSELERQMGLNENVLRSLNIKVDTLEKGPSIMKRHPKERGDRDFSRDTVEETVVQE
ncbi:MAG: 30S ribosomal protein S6 [Alphaproteobacteria bacterium]